MSNRNVISDELSPGLNEYFRLTNGVPIIAGNIESMRYPGPGNFVYRANSEQPEMGGQFNQVQVYPEGVVKFFIEQGTSMSIFIGVKPKPTKRKINPDNFVLNTETFRVLNKLSQEDINYICKTFLQSVLNNYNTVIESASDKPQAEENKNVISGMLQKSDFMMTIVEGMISLKDFSTSPEDIHALKLTAAQAAAPQAAAQSAAAQAAAAQAAAQAAAAVYTFNPPAPAPPAAAVYTFNPPAPSAPSVAPAKRVTRRGTGGKSKRNKSKNGTKRRNKKDKRKTRKYKK
jgi:hypothetical protein